LYMVPLWYLVQANMPIMIMECDGIILARMGSIANLATLLSLLIINRLRRGMSSKNWDPIAYY